MSESKQNITLSELRALRVWRAFLAEARGHCYGLDELGFLVRMSHDDALSAVGMGNSVWARERWSELCDALSEPVEVGGVVDEPLSDAA